MAIPAEYYARVDAVRGVLKLLIKDDYFQTSVPIKTICEGAGVDYEDIEDILPRSQRTKV